MYDVMVYTDQYFYPVLSTQVAENWNSKDWVICNALLYKMLKTVRPQIASVIQNYSLRHLQDTSIKMTTIGRLAQILDGSEPKSESWSHQILWKSSESIRCVELFTWTVLYSYLQRTSYS